MSTLATKSFKKIFQIVLPGLFAAGLFNLSVTHESLEAARSGWPELCFFHRLTGLLCPGCGMTRSLISFFSYNWPLSFRYHPLGPVLGVAAVVFWISSFWPERWLQITARAQAFLQSYAWGLLGLLVTWTIYRNLDFFI